MREINHLAVCLEASRAGGLTIEDARRDKPASSKADSYVGHHAVVSDADFQSQKAILESIKQHDEKSFFITEEHVKEEGFRNRIVGSDQLEKLCLGAYIIDELDGSSSYTIGHYEWSTSVGYVRFPDHVAGAVFAPRIGGGLLFFANAGTGAFVRCGGERRRIKISQRKLKDAYVIFSPDNFLSKYPVHNRLVGRIADMARTVNSNGSCALALAADLLIQPLQCPWDWAAGKLIVEEAGGTILFYELKNQSVKPLDGLELRHYDPAKRAVGLIAGHKTLAIRAMEMLLTS